MLNLECRWNQVLSITYIFSWTGSMLLHLEIQLRRGELLCGDFLVKI